MTPGKIALLLCLLALSCLAITNFSIIQTDGDYANFYNCAKHGVFVNGQPQGCETYPPLLIWILKLFVTREIFFTVFVAVLSAVVFPLILFKITNKPIVVWFYFTTSTFFFVFVSTSFFANGFVFFLVLCMIFVKDWVRIVILLVATISHTTGFVLALGFFVFLLLEENLLHFFPGLCVSVFNNQPTQIGEHTGGFTFPIAIPALFTSIPFYFGIPAVYAFFKTKKFALLALFLSTFFVGLFVDSRGFHFSGVLICLGTTFFWDTASARIKIVLLVLSCVQLYGNMRSIGLFC